VTLQENCEHKIIYISSVFAIRMKKYDNPVQIVQFEAQSYFVLIYVCSRWA